MAFEEHSRLCSQLLNEGIMQVLVNLGQKSLLKYAVFNPGQLASLANFVLLRDITAQAPDTSDTYSEYLSYLVSSIEALSELVTDRTLRSLPLKLIPWIADIRIN
jgi:hypothetical protein